MMDEGSPWVCRLIEYRSNDYAATVDLRYRVLREPLGISHAEWDRSQDEFDALVGAFQGEALIGCLILTDLGNRILKMRAVAVEPHAQGQGIGKLMVAFSEIYARDHGFALMKLSARVTAIPFYLSLGYEVVSEEYEEVTIPHRMMSKSLVEPS